MPQPKIHQLRLATLILPALAITLGTATHSLGNPKPGHPQERERVQPRNLDIRTLPGQPLTAEERSRILEAITSHPKVAPRIRNQRITALRIVWEPGMKDTPERRIASAVVFNYTVGKATRFRIDTTTGELLSEKLLTGRPQSSREEFEEARRIIQRDTEHSRMLGAGGVLEGGFIVDAPEGVQRPEEVLHRYIQIHLLTPDRKHIQRLVSVDLTAKKIALSSAR